MCHPCSASISADNPRPPQPTPCYLFLVLLCCFSKVKLKITAVPRHYKDQAWCVGGAVGGGVRARTVGVTLILPSQSLAGAGLFRPLVASGCIWLRSCIWLEGQVQWKLGREQAEELQSSFPPPQEYAGRHPLPPIWLLGRGFFT